MNKVVQVKSGAVNGPNGPANAMMMAVNIGDPRAADSFVQQVVEQFKLNRIVAPADTSMLLITLIGDMSADRFAATWKPLAGQDPVVSAFMSMMAVAQVVQGTASGQQLSEASLLMPNSAHPRKKPWWKFW